MGAFSKKKGHRKSHSDPSHHHEHGAKAHHGKEPTGGVASPALETPKTSPRKWRLRDVLSPANKDLGTPKLWSPAGKGKGKGSKEKANVHTAAHQEAVPAIDGLEDNGDDLAFKSGKVDVSGICEAKRSGAWAVSSLRAVGLLAQDHRYKLAARVLTCIQTYVEGEGKGEEGAAVRGLMEGEMRECVQLVRQRREEVDVALRELDKPGDWVQCSEMWGVSTFYKLNVDKTLTIKMSGPSQGSVFNQVAVLREGWAYSSWMPMCSQSALLHASKCQALVHLNLSSPLMSRDSILCVYAVDLTDEGSVLFLSDPEGLPHIARPPVPKGFGAGRMDIRDFRFKIEVLGPDRITSTLTAVFDAHAPVPASVLNFATKKIAGAFLALLRREARRVSEDPVNHPIAQRMRDDPFYRTYLVPRMQAFYASKGWAFPPVEALEVDMHAAPRKLPPPLPSLRRTPSLSGAGDVIGEPRQDGPSPPTSKHAPSTHAVKHEGRRGTAALAAWGDMVLKALMILSLVLMLTYRLSSLISA